MRRPYHKPPSRVRYEKSHPTVSCRLNKETYDLLKQHLDELGGVSVADFVKDALGRLQLKMPKPEVTERVKEESKREGYSQAIEEWQIWYYCDICKKKATVKPNSTNHKEIIDFAKRHCWMCESCADHRFRELQTRIGIEKRPRP